MQARTQEIDWGGAFQYIMDLNSAVFVGGPRECPPPPPDFFVKYTLFL